MTQLCWICEKNKANSGEHFITKSSLDFIMGKPDPDDIRYFTGTEGPKNVPIKSFKNDRLKFDKNICQRCNDTLSQPYDDAFNGFIKKLFSKKTSVISRGYINLNSVVGEDQKDNLAIYFMKIFGCLLKHSGLSDNYDLGPLRASILSSQVKKCDLYFAMHRNLKKLEMHRKRFVMHYPVIDYDSAVWIVDLDWVSFTLTYPHRADPKYGTAWLLGEECKKLKLGKLN
jgi:hypothetical protein